jgi:hypothetical protein
MVVQKFDRMALSTAIAYLASGEEDRWFERAQEVLDFGLTIPPVSRYFVDYLFHDTPSSGMLTGFAANIGSLEISDEPKHSSVHRTSAEVARLGVYRVVHYGSVRALHIQHFQKALPYRFPVPTQEFNVDGWALFYAADGKPLMFAETESRTVLTSPPFILWVQNVVDGLLRYVMHMLRFRLPPRLKSIWFEQEMRYRVIHSASSRWARGCTINGLST